MDYNLYKRTYTEGDMFTLSNQDFIGYAQYKDGIATDYDTGALLDFKNTYQTDLFTSNIFRDRNIDDLDIKLPVTKDQCLFSLNDTLNFNTIKFKLDKIRENNTFVFSKLFIASNNLPVTTDIRYASLTSAFDTRLAITETDARSPAILPNTPFLDSDFFKIIGKITNTTSETNYEDSRKFVMFNTTDTQIITLTGDTFGLGIATIDSSYEQSTENILKFKLLGGIASNNTHLFVSDTDNNVVIRYDIRGYLNNDSSLANRMYINGVLGGDGDIDRRINFNKPTKLAVTEDYLAVYDSGNKAIKIFTPNLDYVKTLSILQLKGGVNKETFQAMGFDPDFKSLDVLTKKSDNITAVLYRINIKTRKIERVELNETLQEDEVINNVEFSTADSNYWFFSTNKGVYKKYKTRPDSAGVGFFDEGGIFKLDQSIEDQNLWNGTAVDFDKSGFLWNLIMTTDGSSQSDDSPFKSFNVIKGINGNDRFNIVTSKRIYFFDEPTHTGYKKVINSTNYNNYGVNGFSLTPEEYVQVPVLNNEIYKVVYDLLALKNNIIGRFSGRYNQDKLVLNDYDYINLIDLREDTIENYFLHHNEENLVGAINRIIGNIYDTQETLINFVKVEPTDVTTTSNFYIEDGEFKIEPEIEGLLTLDLVTRPQVDVVNVGDTIRYKATVTNIGSTPVASTILTEQTLFPITITYDPDSIYNNIATIINPGQQSVVEYEYTVLASDGTRGYVRNNTSLIGNNLDEVRGTLTIPAIRENAPVNQPSLAVETSITSTGPYLKGGKVSFKIDVYNNGIITAPSLSAEFSSINTQGVLENINDPKNLIFGPYNSSLESGETTSITFDYTIPENNDILEAPTIHTQYAGQAYEFTSNQVEVDVVDISDGIDAAFIVDYTVSMGPLMTSIKESLNDIADFLNTEANSFERLALITADHGNTISPFITPPAGSYTSLSEYNSLSAEQKIIEDSGYDTGGPTPLDEDVFSIDHNVYYYHTCWKQFSENSPQGNDAATIFKNQVNKLNTASIPLGVYGYIGQNIYLDNSNYVHPWSLGSDRAIEKVLDDDLFVGEFENLRLKVIVLFTDTFNCTIGNEPSGNAFNSIYAKPVLRDNNLPQLSKVRSLAQTLGVKIVVMGPGVDYSVTDFLGPGESVTLNDVIYSNYYPWRELAESTGGTWRNTVDTASLEDAFREIFDI